jgi:hypothetical protein
MNVIKGHSCALGHYCTQAIQNHSCSISHSCTNETQGYCYATIVSTITPLPTAVQCVLTVAPPVMQTAHPPQEKCNMHG